MLIVMLYAADQADAVSAAELYNYRIMDYLAKRQSRSFLSYVIDYNSTISFESMPCTILLRFRRMSINEILISYMCTFI